MAAMPEPLKDVKDIRNLISTWPEEANPNPATSTTKLQTV